MLVQVFKGCGYRPESSSVDLLLRTGPSGPVRVRVFSGIDGLAWEWRAPRICFHLPVPPDFHGFKLDIFVLAPRYQHRVRFPTPTIQPCPQALHCFHFTGIESVTMESVLTCSRSYIHQFHVKYRSAVTVPVGTAHLLENTISTFLVIK